MKIKRTLLSLAVVFIGVTVNYAQGTSAEKIEGSPYLNDAFVPGEIYFGDAGLTKAPVRYNIYRDNVEYEQNGKALALDPTKKIKKIQMGDETFLVEKLMVDGKSKYGFVSLLDSGKVTLFAKKVVRYQPEMKGRGLDGGDQPAKFSRLADAYFFKIGDGELMPVGNLKDFIASLPDKHEELKQYAKQEKISVKKQDELRQFIRYYNSL